MGWKGPPRFQFRFRAICIACIAFSHRSWITNLREIASSYHSVVNGSEDFAKWEIQESEVREAVYIIHTYCVSLLGIKPATKFPDR